MFSSLAPAADGVTGVLESVRSHHVPFIVQVWEQAPSSVDEAIVAAGAGRSGGLPLMTLDLEGTSETAVPQRIEIARVASDDHVRAHRETSALVFGTPPGVSEALSPPAALASDRCGYFLALAGEDVVGTSVSFVSGDVVGIFGVTTLAQHRGRGIGAALTQRAIDYGRDHGATLAFLQASEAGFSVYLRMGFEVIGHHRFFHADATPV